VKREFNPARVPHAETSHLGIVSFFRGALKTVGEPFHPALGVALILTFECSIATVQEPFEFARFFHGTRQRQGNPPGAGQFVKIGLNLIERFQREPRRFNEISIFSKLQQPLGGHPLQEHLGRHVPQKGAIRFRHHHTFDGASQQMVRLNRRRKRAQDEQDHRCR
jgi:hypothetical protein